MLQAVHGWSSTYERLVKSQKFFSSYLTQEDLSRFGREYAQMGLYIEHYFEEKGIRFIAVAEGAISKEDVALSKKEYKNKLANYQYPSVSYELAEQIMQRTGADVRVTVPGHTQRGGSPVPYDRVLSTRLGARAAQLIIQEEYGYMVGIINGETCKVPLDEVAGKLKMVDPNSGIIEEAKMIGISFGD